MYMTLLVARTFKATVVLGLTIHSSSLFAASQWNIPLNTRTHHEPTTRANPFNSFFSAATGWNETPIQGGSYGLTGLIKKALAAIENDNRNSLVADAVVGFSPERALGDSDSATIKLAQTYKGLEVVGQDTMIHFDRGGVVAQTTNGTINAALNVQPSLSSAQALRVLTDRYQQDVQLSEPATLKVLQDFEGKTRVVYHLLTSSTPTHDGQEVYLDAHTGAVVLEFARVYHAHAFDEPKPAPKGGYRTVYSAKTAAARKSGRVDVSGYPTSTNFDWYDKVFEDNTVDEDALDRSALNAYRNSGKVYEYLKKSFDRKSFDDKDTRIKSIVHMGVKMNNALWSSEYNVMIYGDGDNQILQDLTYGLDVAAHEITHGVINSTAKLVYAAEPGALNESFADFFGKMVDYNEDDWLIGARIMAPKTKMRALRNMEIPEEFGQPGDNNSPLRKRTDVLCSRGNDGCGVHANSGIPNRASMLVVKAIGKEKAEQLYYRVLTRHLTATSGFAEMRAETEKACGLMYGADSADCAGVKAAFDTVKM